MEQKEHTYPIAEIFESVQGEGAQAGIAMTFVRLAGCTVGKPYTSDARNALGLEVFQERCTSWDGESFPCDTNYRKHHRATVQQLLAMSEIKSALYVSLTGGEPLMHDVAPLIAALLDGGKHVHIETSGTLELSWELPLTYMLPPELKLWLTVSPKYGVLDSMLDIAHEIRVMVDSNFNPRAFFEKYEKYIAQEKVWISPVNDLNTINVDNMKKCLALQQTARGLRLSIQQHKIWNVR